MAFNRVADQLESGAERLFEGRQVTLPDLWDGRTAIAKRETGLAGVLEGKKKKKNCKCKAGAVVAFEC